jgi:hypothetical protein
MASLHASDLGEALKDMIKISRLYTRVEFVQGCPASQSSEQAQYLHSVGSLRKWCQMARRAICTPGIILAKFYHGPGKGLSGIIPGVESQFLSGTYLMFTQKAQLWR